MNSIIPFKQPDPDTGSGSQSTHDRSISTQTLACIVLDALQYKGIIKPDDIQLAAEIIEEEIRVRCVCMEERVYTEGDGGFTEEELKEFVPYSKIVDEIYERAKNPPSH